MKGFFNKLKAFFFPPSAVETALLIKLDQLMNAYYDAKYTYYDLTVLLEKPEEFEEAVKTMAEFGYEPVSGDGLLLTFRKYRER